MQTKPIKYSAHHENSPISACAGIGLKPQHFFEIIENQPKVGWFEVHPENYMVPGGPMLYNLHKIRENYPLSFHSIGMSLGTASGIDKNHTLRLKELIERFQPSLVSDHLSWSRWGQNSLNDLLPVPYTQEALSIMVENVSQVQDILGRQIAIENPSSYFDIAGADLSEAEFLVELVKKSGASILLDVNNIFVSANNHAWSAAGYLEQIPAELVSEIHLAGHKREKTSSGEILIDDHGSKVCDEVWALYKLALSQIGRKPTLIEWDTDIPLFSTLLDEKNLADKMLIESFENSYASPAMVAH